MLATLQELESQRQTSIHTGNTKRRPLSRGKGDVPHCRFVTILSLYWKPVDRFLHTEADRSKSLFGTAKCLPSPTKRNQSSLWGIVITITNFIIIYYIPYCYKYSVLILYKNHRFSKERTPSLLRGVLMSMAPKPLPSESTFCAQETTESLQRFVYPNTEVELLQYYRSCIVKANINQFPLPSSWNHHCQLLWIKREYHLRTFIPCRSKPQAQPAPLQNSPGVAEVLSIHQLTHQVKSLRSPCSQQKVPKWSCLSCYETILYRSHEYSLI